MAAAPVGGGPGGRNLPRGTKGRLCLLGPPPRTLRGTPGAVKPQAQGALPIRFAPGDLTQVARPPLSPAANTPVQRPRRPFGSTRCGHEGSTPHPRSDQVRLSPTKSDYRKATRCCVSLLRGSSAQHVSQVISRDVSQDSSDQTVAAGPPRSSPCSPACPRPRRGESACPRTRAARRASAVPRETRDYRRGWRAQHSRC